MINIELDERCVFNYSSKDKYIGIWRHDDGFLKGDVIGILGTIKFANKWQIEHFREMLDLLSTNRNVCNKNVEMIIFNIIIGKIFSRLVR